MRRCPLECCFPPVCRVWERQNQTGLGAQATADMAGKRPLRALGPMMSALILWPIDSLRFVESSISYQEERAEIDARSHRCPPSHMPALA
ncbi:MAG: hypothetical protein J6T22_13615 [Bacteroidales bacterium]|nr:hypothetical protein [Bacteroidales bacterium]